MNVSITGHRPERIQNPLLVQKGLQKAYEDLRAFRVIQGMAAGVDLWSAREAFLSGVPYICAVPWKGHGPRKIDKFSYDMALKHAEEVHYVNEAEDYPGPWVYQRRNEWMVDRADTVIAVWDGVEKGGTWNCVAYARKKSIPIYRIDPNSGEVTNGK